MQEITQAISQVIALANNLKTNPNTNKKFLNKTISRLEDAWLVSQHLDKNSFVDSHPAGNLAPAQAPFNTLHCICPDGALDSNCPVHINPPPIGQTI